MSRRRSKYPSIGLLDFLERKLYGGVPRFEYNQFYSKVSQSWPIDRDLFSRRLNSLKRSGLIRDLAEGEIILTAKGLERINLLHLEKLTLRKKKRDGFWRLIIFDIPETQKQARKLLRDKLLEFECYQLQKSIYVTPFVCEKEIGEIAKILSVSDGVEVIVAKSLGSKEDKIRRYFAKR